MEFIHGGNALLFRTFFIVVIWPFLVGFLIKYCWKPWTIHRALRKQGFKGPPPLFMMGSLLDIANMVHKELSKDMPCIHHDIRNRVFPFFVDWSKIYGERFVIWFGYEPRIVLTDPEEIKQLLSSKYIHDTGVSPMIQEMLSVAFGKSLITVNGEKWAQQRRIVAPAFHAQKLKPLVEISVTCTKGMLSEWECMAGVREKACEIELMSQMETLTANIFMRAEFGLDYSKGKDVFEDMSCLEDLMLQTFFYLWIPCSRFLPTPSNLQIWKRNRRLERNLKRIIQDRRDSGSYGNDLLGLMLSEIDGVSTHDKNFNYTTQQIMDDCKTFFMAGKKNTSALISWAIFLLALNQEWQHKAREEVNTVCGTQNPSPDSVGKLKIIGMTLNETLRLYPPASAIIKQAFKDLELGNGLVIPKEGIAKAGSHSLAFVPFSRGPRVCIGQNFAMLEAKVVVAMVLRDFQFAISSSYKHAPTAFLTLTPQHGIPIMIQRVHS
eukprot:Gb_15611 [translate_table: standard]